MAGGRPTDYRPEFVERVKELAANGATIHQIAESFRVSKPTIYTWRNKYPEFLAALNLNKAIADEIVERSLYERATGYSHESVKIFCSKDGNVTQVPYVEHVPPDPTSMIFWLKNRKSKEWRDRSEVEIPGLAVLAERLNRARARASDPVELCGETQKRLEGA